MSTRENSPEKRSKAVKEETARLLSESVIQFTSQALDSRFEPFTNSALRAATQAKLAAEKADEACQDLQLALDNLRKGPPALTSFLDRAEKRLEKTENSYLDLAQSAMTTATKAFENELQPLLNNVSEAARCAKESAFAAEYTSKNLLLTLDKLSNGPPALLSYLERAESRLSVIEKSFQTTASRIINGLIVACLCLVVVVVWLIQR